MSSYDAQYGDESGKVRKKDFSIDGKSWEYRNPANFNDGNERGRDTPTYNRDAYEMSNPLYDYSYEQARDAAKALEIGNVNKKEEVTSIIEHIKNQPSPEPEKVKAKKPKNKQASGTDAASGKPVKTVLSKEAAEANAFVDTHNAMTLGNSSPLQGMAVSNKAGASSPKAAAFKENFQLNLGGTSTPLNFTEAITGTKPTVAAPFMDNYKNNIKGWLEPK